MMRFGWESLDVNNVQYSDEVSMTCVIMNRLHTMLKPHQTTLQSLRIGFSVTPYTYLQMHRPGFEQVFPGRTGFGLHHNTTPNFLEYESLKHLHLSAIFAGHANFFHKRKRAGKNPEILKELHEELDRLLGAPSLTRLTLDVGTECALRHGPCFSADPAHKPKCTLLCPLDRDLWAFLLTLARRAHDTKAKLREIHVNYAVRPFARSVPVKDSPAKFNVWGFCSSTLAIDPWTYLEVIKRRMGKLGIVFTYTCLEPICGVPRTHLPDPEIPVDMDPHQANTLRRRRDLRLFEYEDEMCSEHIWTVVKPGWTSYLGLFEDLQGQ